MVAGLPRRRAGRDRRPHAGVLLRARDRPGPAGDQEREIDYPVAVDNDYAIWSAFDNHYWPALYFIDSDGVIRDQHFGEGRYEQSERVIQRLLGVDRELVSVEGRGVEAAADWDHLRSPETYLGYGRSERFASADGPRSTSAAPTSSPSGCGSTSGRSPGDWTIGPENVVLDQAGGSIAFRFQARDAHLVMSAGGDEPIPFRVLLDGAGARAVARRRRRRGRERPARDGRLLPARTRSTARSASGRSRSPSASPAPRRTSFTFG